MENKTPCNDMCGSSKLPLPCIWWLCNLRSHDQMIIDTSIHPKIMCLLIVFMICRTFFRRHDYKTWQLPYIPWLYCCGFVCNQRDNPNHIRYRSQIGGGVSELFSFAHLQPYLLENHIVTKPSTNLMYKFEGYYVRSTQSLKYIADEDFLFCNIPLHNIIGNLTISSLKVVAAAHGIYIKTRTPLLEVVTIIKAHICADCPKYITVFKPAKIVSSKRKETNARAVEKYRRNRISLNKNVLLEKGDIECIKKCNINSRVLDR